MGIHRPRKGNTSGIAGIGKALKGTVPKRARTSGLVRQSNNFGPAPLRFKNVSRVQPRKTPGIG